MLDKSVEKPAWLFLLTWPITTVGGVNEVVLALAEQVRSRGYHPILGIATWDGTPQPPEVRGVEMIGLRVREPLSYSGGWRALPGFGMTVVSDLLQLRRLVRERNVQVINPHFPGTEATVYLLLKTLGMFRGSVVLSFHSNDVADIKRSPQRVQKFWSRLLRRPDHLVSCSRDLGGQVEALSPGVKAAVIHNGVDAGLFTAPSNRPWPAAPVILNVAKYEHKKSQDALLEAFRRLLDSGIQARLMLVGSEGPMLAETRELIEHLNLGADVDMRVSVPHREIPALMEAADLFVLPSRAEGFPLVLMEAGAAGLPVIATTVGGIPELLTDERTALLIPPNDVSALEKALARMLTDHPLRTRLANELRSEVLAHWSWDETGRKYVALIRGR